MTKCLNFSREKMVLEGLQTVYKHYFNLKKVSDVSKDLRVLYE